ncbi:MAG: response regulator [Verrucomicrobia bacterium]|nr:response regulator [Verrucomicrobiota bacterium]
MKIRTLIVDDERLARQRIRLLARDEPDLEIIGECASGHDALAAIERDTPALLLLDVQMPEMDGFELLQKLPREKLPAIIFTTAFDQHAVRAFEEHALDYLLKPFKPERFHAAIARARQHLAKQEAADAGRRSLEQLLTQFAKPAPAAQRFLSRITVKTDDKVFIVPTADVDSIESAGNYVAVNVGKESHILRETLNSLEAQLDPEKFLRVSRSALVNLDRVKELQPMFKGENILILHNGRRIPMTRGLREVEQALKFG